jgi:3-dehydroquinate synthase
VRYVLLTDSRVRRLYGEALTRRLRRSGIDVLGVAVPAGERSKTREAKARVEDAMTRAGLGRDAALIALGGGVVGDLGGFVAATYCRGIPFIQVPTTLLAMVDSSIGGKTAVDHPRAKNWIGAIHQPAAVWMDVATLKDLSARQFRNGLAEVIKTAIIADARLFRFLEKNLETIVARTGPVLTRIVSTCCRIKARVVERDEADRNLRKILNFGHTIGHALERLAGYRMPHGEAVSIGIAAESRIARRLGLLDPDSVVRVEALLRAARLPVRLPAGIRPERLLDAARLDKKARRGRAEYVLPADLGRMARRRGAYAFPVPAATVRAALAEIS